MGRIKGWCLPGGKVDPCETFIQGAIRETKEETGIKIGIPKYVGDGQSKTLQNYRSKKLHQILS